MITIVGSVNLDMIGNVEQFPMPGETIICSRYSVSPGGKGANQALAARRSGSDVCLIAAVGRDAAAQSALVLLDEAGVDLGHVTRSASHTGQAMILVNGAGENTIAIAPGANGDLDPNIVQRLVHERSGRSILLLQQEVAADVVDAALSAGRRGGQTTILNIAPYADDHVELSRQADILIANEGEFECVSGVVFDSKECVASWAAERGQTVIVTLGAKGVIVATEGEVFSVPAVPVEAVSTVGAGDTFCGYFASGLDLGLNLADAVARAVSAASRACLLPGAQPSIPWASELNELAGFRRYGQ